MIEGVLMLGQSEGGPPQRGVIGTLLMLPIGVIIVLALLFYFISFRRGWFPGEILLISVALFVGLFVVRSLYWRSRRKYWRERFRRNEPMHILRQRYARGEITREQFDQMRRDLAQSPGV